LAGGGSSLHIANKPVWIAVADFNGDGIPSNVTILLGTGGGNFGTPATVDTGGTGTDALSVLDLNGDGKLDLVAGNNTSGTLAVLAGNGNGTFAAPRLIELVSARAIAPGDLMAMVKQICLSPTTR
jgi:hypothetical protein